VRGRRVDPAGTLRRRKSAGGVPDPTRTNPRPSAVRAGRAFIGTSGWSYEGWRPSFYGPLPKVHWLRFCARQFTGIEVNATFYRLQRTETFARWRSQTPAGFRFAIKANRYLTHTRRLKEPVAPVQLERDRARALGDRLAVVLWQLPATLHRDLGRLHGFLRALRRWRRVRHAIEFRHVSWFDDEVAALLQRHRVAVCLSDAADWPCWDTVTTDLVYVRLHGHTATYASGYSGQALRRWAVRIRQWTRQGRDVHLYFDNDAFGHAPRDALRLLALLR
jgi:uncharacterized protein YecE (DUF72 family)